MKESRVKEPLKLTNLKHLLEYLIVGGRITRIVKSSGLNNLKRNNMKETLEEAAERYSSISFNRQDLYDGFIEGASWQQEQILQFLYSEITERRPYSSSKMCEEVIKFIEQFKKK